MRRCLSAWVPRCLSALVLSALVLVALCTASVSAQHEGHQPAPARPTAKPEPTPQPAKVLGWEPIRCWRQSSAGAVTIGESFTVVLTCAVYEADNAQVIPDESRLGVASIQMAPFEILGGSHPPDVHRGSRRFFQYDYQLRIIGPDAIGRDVNIPALPISYRIHSRVGAAATLEGRDLSYVMPMMPIKVLSLVPADASDIRDASEASLTAVDSLRFRSNVFRVLTFTLGALAVVMAVLALVPLTRTRSAAAAADSGRLADRAVLDRAVKELEDVQRQVSGGRWTESELLRAFGSLRLVAAVAIEHPISQKPVIDRVVPEGRLSTDRGLFRKSTVSLSSPVTADDVARAGSRWSATRQQQLEGLREGLLAFTRALYSREPKLDSPALDDAVRHAIAVARDVAGERSWWKTWAKR
jgi:hypothetical protein